MSSSLATMETHERGTAQRLPKLGFLGAGWIGRNRLEAVATSGLAEVAAIGEPVPELAAKAQERAPGAELVGSLEELLERDLDGIVIATPSALHAAQCEAALQAGLPVFCQKPLGRNAEETNRVVGMAKRADLLLGVDLSYRHLSSVSAVKRLIEYGELGQIFAAELTFHNAYGPDKPWFYNRAQSGGGCVIDLGIHMVDLALWMIGGVEINRVESRLFSKGAPLTLNSSEVEDFAAARLDLSSGAVAQVSCSWNLPAGCDAIISAVFYGTKGGAAVRNVNGSFYDFAAERFHGTRCEVLTDVRESWGGRAILQWAKRLAEDASFDSSIESLRIVAETLDEIYRKGCQR